MPRAALYEGFGIGELTNKPEYANTCAIRLSYAVTKAGRALAVRLNTVWVPEFGREHWELKGGRLEFDDMLNIAEVKAKRELILARLAKQWCRFFDMEQPL